MPSASSSTSAPGHTRCSNPGISNGPDAKVSPGSSRSCFEARATSRSSPSAVPFRVPLHPLLTVDPDRDERGLGVELVGRHHARADRERTPRGGHRVAVRAPGEPVAHQRVSEDDRGRLLGRERVVHRATQDRRDLRMELEPPGALRPRDLLVGPERRPAALDGVRVSGARSAAAPRADVVVRRRSASASSRSRAARAASSTVPPLLLTSRSIVSGNAGWPSRLGRSTTFPSRSAPSRRCPRRSKVTSLKGGR